LFLFCFLLFSSSPVLFCPWMFSETTKGISIKLSRMIV
jgi:hypothetical protein